MAEHNLDTIIQLGDLFDRRKFVQFKSLARSREYLFEPMRKNNIQFHVCIGNHDTAFKNTNELNSPDLLLKEYPNIHIYSSPQDVEIDGFTFAFIPWICSGNYQETIDYISKTKAQIAVGHLELAGFEMYKGNVNDHGFDRKIFDKFDSVFTGHFHHKSSHGNIHYLGTPYEITWSDWNDPRGFHVFDTETRELTFIENQYRMFHKLHYDDSSGDLDSILNFDTSKLTGHMIKVIVHTKNNPYWFDMFTKKIESCDPLDLQIVEDNFHLDLTEDEDLIEDTEDTLAVLHKYTEQFSDRTDVKKLNMFLSELYQEALAVE